MHGPVLIAQCVQPHPVTCSVIFWLKQLYSIMASIQSDPVSCLLKILASVCLLRSQMIIECLFIGVILPATISVGPTMGIIGCEPVLILKILFSFSEEKLRTNTTCVLRYTREPHDSSRSCLCLIKALDCSSLVKVLQYISSKLFIFLFNTKQVPEQNFSVGGPQNMPKGPHMIIA